METLLILSLVVCAHAIRFLQIPVNALSLDAFKDRYGCIPIAGQYYCNYTNTCNQIHEPCYRYLF
jgi:hypothetical protein